MILAYLNANNNYTYSTQISFDIDAEKTYHFVLRDCEKSILKDHFSRDSRI